MMREEKLEIEVGLTRWGIFDGGEETLESCV